MQIYFNRPAKPICLDQLYRDVKRARWRLVIASAWFTLVPLVEAFLDSEARQRFMLISRSDWSRPGSGDAKRLLEQSAHYVHVLGSGDFRDGTMHHKFICADEIVWVGSYNFTFQAAKNYETLMRIDGTAADTFYEEAVALRNAGTPLHAIRIETQVASHLAEEGKTLIDHCMCCGWCWSDAVEGYMRQQWDSHGAEAEYICKACKDHEFAHCPFALKHI